MANLLLSVVLLVHGAIHLMGFAKAFDYARIEALTQPITRPLGLLWLLAALLFIASAALRFAAPSLWWLAALPAVVLSQVLIIGTWSDAKAGTVANLIVLVPLALTLLDLRPASFQSQYRQDVASRLKATELASLVTDADLGRLPAPVQRYLRRVGVVGQPRVRNFRVTFRGTFRSKPDGAWMTLTAEQHTFLGEPARLFLMQAALFGLPFDAYHRYTGGKATMQVRAASVVDVVDAKGPQMDQSETVTFFNDLCLLAPAALVDVAVHWREIDERQVEAAFTLAGHTVTATLTFDGNGDLVGFVSQDRFQSADGKTYRQLPWSTPIGDYRNHGPFRLASKGEASWLEPSGPAAYGRFELQEVVYNVTAP